MMRRFWCLIACVVVFVINEGCTLHVHLGGTYYVQDLAKPKVEVTSDDVAQGQEDVDWQPTSQHPGGDLLFGHVD